MSHRTRTNAGLLLFYTVVCALAPWGCGKANTNEISPSPLAPTAQSSPVADPTPTTKGTRVVLLGTGTPTPDPGRSGSAVAVIVDGHPYLVDFGAGVIAQATRAFVNGEAALDPTKLTTAFVTHLHTDHTVGYPDLIFTPWVVGRKEPLSVWGPVGLETMTQKILEAWEEDLQVRMEGKPADWDRGRKVEVHEISPGPIFKDSRVRVTAFPVTHGAWGQAFGYRFDTPDRSVVISGDTTASDAVVDACNGCDILVHEVYSTAGFLTGPQSWREYHSSYHTSSLELAQLATRARPKLLVLYHQLFFGRSQESLLEEVRSAYKGPVRSAQDLDVF